MKYCSHVTYCLFWEIKYINLVSSFVLHLISRKLLPCKWVIWIGYKLNNDNFHTNQRACVLRIGTWGGADKYPSTNLHIGYTNLPLPCHNNLAFKFTHYALSNKGNKRPSTRNKPCSHLKPWLHVKCININVLFNYLAAETDIKRVMLDKNSIVKRHKRQYKVNL